MPLKNHRKSNTYFEYTKKKILFEMFNYTFDKKMHIVLLFHKSKVKKYAFLLTNNLVYVYWLKMSLLVFGWMCFFLIAANHMNNFFTFDLF